MIYSEAYSVAYIFDPLRSLIDLIIGCDLFIWMCLCMSHGHQIELVEFKYVALW